MELTPCVRVNAAAQSADKSFRLDYKKLSLKLSRAPSSDKEYSGPISVFRAWTTCHRHNFCLLRVCVSLCVCDYTHMLVCIDRITYMYICTCAQLHLHVPGIHSSTHDPGSMKACVMSAAWVVYFCVCFECRCPIVFVCAWDRVSQVFSLQVRDKAVGWRWKPTHRGNSWEIQD